MLDKIFKVIDIVLFMKKEGKYRPAVFVIVYRRTKSGEIEYIVLKRKKHWIGWEFPKGGIDKGEGKLKTAQREVYEETGLRALKVKRHNKSDKYKYNRLL